MKKDLIVSINKTLSKINGVYQKWYQKNTLNSYLLQTLNALYNEPELSQKEISENYQIPPQTVNNAIKSMERQGYLKLVPDEADKRRRSIVFTDRGRAYAKNAVSPLTELDANVARRMGEKKYSQLISLLEDYGTALQKETEGTIL